MEAFRKWISIFFNEKKDQNKCKMGSEKTYNYISKTVYFLGKYLSSIFLSQLNKLNIFKKYNSAWFNGCNKCFLANTSSIITIMAIFYFRSSLLFYGRYDYLLHRLNKAQNLKWILNKISNLKRDTRSYLINTHFIVLNFAFLLTDVKHSACVFKYFVADRF